MPSTPQTKFKTIPESITLWEIKTQNMVSKEMVLISTKKPPQECKSLQITHLMINQSQTFPHQAIRQ